MPLPLLRPCSLQKNWNLCNYICRLTNKLNMSQPNETKDPNQHDLINICNIRTGWKVSNWLWIKQCIKTYFSSKFSIEMFIPADPHQSSLALEVWQQLLHPILVWKQMLLGSVLSFVAEILPCCMTALKDTSA